MYKQILSELKALETTDKGKHIKTSAIDAYNKNLIKKGVDVSDLAPHILSEQILHRTYFQVSLARLKSVREQFEFIERNAKLLQDWWHVDQLIQFIKKPIDFNFAYKKAKEYVNSPLTFLRRWGYVLFLTGLQKDPVNTNKILSLIKDDSEYYVQMAEAWLLCDLAIFNFDAVYKFLQTTKINYNITGKAVQKCCDSFRLSAEQKNALKDLRAKLKLNV